MQTGIFEGRVLVPYAYGCYGYTRGGGKTWHGGTLYRCVQAHTTQSGWEPDKTPALWVAVSLEEWPEFVQPSGAHDAYNVGDKVTYKGEKYICQMAGCVWAPDVYPAAWDKQ